MSLFVKIIPLIQSAAAFIQAAVANIRRVEQTEADLFFVSRTNAVAKMAQSTLPYAIRFIFAKLDTLTFKSFNATIFRTICCELLAFDSTFLYFAGDSRFCFADSFGDSVQWIPILQQYFDLQAVGIGEVCFFRYDKNAP